MSRCPLCGRYKSKKTEILDHMEEEHDIPENMSIAMYFYSLNHNGATTGSCRVCKKPTPWNEDAGLPSQLCGKPECKKLARENAVKNMIKKYNKPHLLNDWKQQEKMLANRKISGTYHWSDGKSTKTYTGKNELALAKFYDTVLNREPSRLQMPGPVIPYVYNGQEKFWITDAYDEDFNFIIECKDGGNNKNMHPGFAYNREIEALKDEVMKNQSQYNYVKVTDKNIFQLIEVLATIRDKQLGESLKEAEENELKKPVVAINENAFLHSGVYVLVYGSRDNDILSDVAISFDSALTELYTMMNNKVTCLSSSNEYFSDKFGILYYLDYNTNIPAMLEYIQNTDINNITSLQYIRRVVEAGGYDLRLVVAKPSDFMHDDNFKRVCDIDDIAKYDIVEENTSMLTECIDSTVDYMFESVLNESISSTLQLLRPSVFIQNVKEFTNRVSAIFNKVDIHDGLIEIRGINFKRLGNNLKEYYSEKGLYKIFDKQYKMVDQILFEKKKLNRGKMRVDHLVAHEFFALELFKMFEELYIYFGISAYGKVAADIYSNSWLSKSNVNDIPELDTSALPHILEYNLKDYQSEFIKEYNKLKCNSGLRGYILSFEQGLGKTLTSISLAECLGKERIYIICPNSLKENWAYEIKEYYFKYKNNEQLWSDEVYIVGSNRFEFSNNSKFVICNQESIKKIDEYIKHGNSMIIVDESHNFRSLGKRSNELLSLIDKTGCDDTLLMSGTPIKSTPNEIIPALMCIDPLFTSDVARVYNRCFNVEGVMASSIVKERFSRIIYRKTKDEVLTLPSKNVSELKLNVSEKDKYLMDNVKNSIVSRFNEIYKERMKDNVKLYNEFIEIVNKYSSTNSSLTKKYLQYIAKTTNTGVKVPLHELDQVEYDSFLRNYVYPNITPDIRIKLNSLEKNYIMMERSSMGRAVGEILPKSREELYIKLYNENKKMFIDMITNNNRKTIIFSSMLKVVNHIAEDLSSSGLGVVKIIGGQKNRSDEIIRFKEDDSIDVLIATTQTLSTGVTLTQANQMLFFGTPWRSADFEQACDRIHRIGQTSDVNIKIVLLDTGAKLNISTRMQKILEWSNKMFGTMIDGEEVKLLTESADIIVDESSDDISNTDIQYGCADIDPLFEEVINKFNDMNIELPETTDIISESAHKHRKKLLKPDIPLTSEEKSKFKRLYGSYAINCLHHNADGYYVRTRMQTKIYPEMENMSLTEIKHVMSAG